VFKLPASLSFVAVQLGIQFKNTTLRVLPIHDKRSPSLPLEEANSWLAVQLLKNYLPARIMVINCEIRVVIYILFGHFGNEKYRKEETKFHFVDFSKRADRENW
jgi:hypothetical protein